MAFYSMESYESDFIDKLLKKNISYEYASTAILVYFRNFTRPEAELPDLLNRFSILLDKEKVDKAIKWMLENGLAERYKLSSFTCIKATNDFPDLMELLTDIPGLADALDQQKKLVSIDVMLTPLDRVSSGDNYSTMLSRIRSAKESVKYVMLCTKYYEETAHALTEVAEKGVKVLLLFGDDDVVQTIRGKARTSTAIQWKKAFSGVKNIEIRIFHNIKNAELCSSVLIDDSILRYIVYDPMTMNSLDGYLIDIVNKGNQNLNIINWFKDKFDEAWISSSQNTFIGFIKNTFSPLVISIVVFLLSSYMMINDQIFKNYSENTREYITEVLLLIIGGSGTFLVHLLYKKFKKFFYRITIAYKSIG